MNSDPYRYHTDKKILDEINHIHKEISISYANEQFFAVILLGGALNERVLTEKLLGHTVIDQKENGIVFVRKNAKIFFSKNEKAFVHLIKNKQIELCKNEDNKLVPLKMLIYAKNKRYRKDRDKILNIFHIKPASTFQTEINLASEIGIGNELDTFKKIHEIRIKYFHPLGNINLSQLKKDGNDVMELSMKLVKSFYRLIIP